MFKERNDVVTASVLSGRGNEPATYVVRWRTMVLAALVLVACFGRPLYQLARFAAGSELYSHIFIIPLISLYLIRLYRKDLIWHGEPARKLALPFFVSGILLLCLYWFPTHGASKAKGVDYLAVTSLSFLLFFIGILCLFLGKNILRAIAFPLALLIFIVPIPVFVMERVVDFLQYGSAAVAEAMFKLAGTPTFREDLIFRLPGTSLRVAPECSGIHSTLVLLITSLVAGYLFLRAPWKRSVLTLAVIPLALLRNGFRIVTIGELCVHVGPHMVESPIHRKGGPIFFALSLVPFFLLLYFLRRSHKKSPTGLK